MFDAQNTETNGAEIVKLQSWALAINLQSTRKTMKKKISDKTRNVRVNVTLRHVLVTIVAVEKQISITYCEFASVALVIQYAMRMRHIVICVLPNSTIFLHIITYKARSSKEKVAEHNICVLISSTIFIRNILTIRKIERYEIKYVYWFFF